MRVSGCSGLIFGVRPETRLWEGDGGRSARHEGLARREATMTAARSSSERGGRGAVVGDGEESARASQEQAGAVHLSLGVLESVATVGEKTHRITGNPKNDTTSRAINQRVYKTRLEQNNQSEPESVRVNFLKKRVYVYSLLRAHMLNLGGIKHSGACL